MSGSVAPTTSRYWANNDTSSNRRQSILLRGFLDIIPSVLEGDAELCVRPLSVKDLFKERCLSRPGQADAEQPIAHNLVTASDFGRRSRSAPVLPIVRESP